MSTPEAKKKSNGSDGDDKVSGERRALDGDDKVSREGVNHGAWDSSFVLPVCGITTIS